MAESGWVDELEAKVAGITREVGPTVVGIGAGWGVGSGIVVGEDRVLTNAHNLGDDEPTVTFADGRSVTGRISGADVDGDLAVVRVDTHGAPTVAWRSEDGVRPGTPVFALARPGGRPLRTTFGLVSATEQAFRGPRGRRISGAIEHTAPLQRGSSGGPIVDGSGRLVGVNTNRLGDGFYLAVPAGASLRAAVESLARGETPSRVRLGVAITPPRVARRLRDAVGLPDRDGLLVGGVEEDSPAERAGLARGDLIIEAAGTAVRSPEDLFAVLDRVAPGATLALRVLRGTEELDLTARL